MSLINNVFSYKIYFILVFISILLNSSVYAETYKYAYDLPQISTYKNPLCRANVEKRIYDDARSAAEAAAQYCYDGFEYTNWAARERYKSVVLKYERLSYVCEGYYNRCDTNIPSYQSVWKLFGTITATLKTGEVEIYSTDSLVIIWQRLAPIEKKYTIKLSQVTAKPSIHGNYITDIYPAKNFINNSEPNANPIITSDELVAIVYDENEQKINNVDIHVEIEPVESTAGHFKHGVRPKKVSTYGQLITTTSLDLQLEGNTGTEGFKFRYLAAELSGDYNIKVTCKDKVCSQTQPSKIWVGVENLIPLEKIASLYKFIGDKPIHPDNHYVTEKTRVKMITLAVKYKTKFPNNTVLHYNDSSLERGGLFDVGKVKWKPPHKTHRVGTDVDVRANEAFGNIPSEDDAEFRRLARRSGCDARLERIGTIYEHFHLYCERRYD